eukprot:scaffold30751_cov33-Phaeocystis_antarctica.AAC.2
MCDSCTTAACAICTLRLPPVPATSTGRGRCPLTGRRRPTTHRRAGLWVLLDEVRREERAAQARADEERAADDDVEAAGAARLEGMTRRSWWRAIDDAVVDADVLRAGLEAEAEAETAAATTEAAAAGGAAGDAAASAEGSPLTPPTPMVAGA